MRGKPLLRVLTGAHHGKEFILPRSRVIIGRELTCGVVFDEPVLSRRHCAIYEENGAFWIADLKSKNGTYLNGNRVDKNSIEPGDVIRIGSTRLEFTFQNGDDPNEAAPQQPSEFHVRKDGESKDPRDPMVDVEIGPYKIAEKIGEGGMGAVYRAMDRNHSNDFVAIKIMNKALTLEEDQVQRFRREFEAGQELMHPNIVQTLDFGRWDDTFYIVMEYVRGHGLQDILDIRGRLSPRGAVKVGLQVALALEHAFQLKIIHRDIKPENILITPQGVVKLLDLGLAKKIKESSGGSSITKTGEGIGTLHYMAPEQTINARDTDQRSDIYALGATLYHMIAGEPPFEAQGIWEFVELIQNGKPKPLTEHVPDLPEQVWSVVAVALEKHPRDRYQTPKDFRKSLENLLKIL